MFIQNAIVLLDSQVFPILAKTQIHSEIHHSAVSHHKCQ